MNLLLDVNKSTDYMSHIVFYPKLRVRLVVVFTKQLSEFFMLTNRTYTAISLFSGAGGMDVGFKKANIFPRLANDIDPDACESYRKNHPEHPILQGDIKGYVADLKKHKSADFVFGGPPCQGFSVAGKMNPDDVRNELLMVYADIVGLISPKVFVCENVKALAVLEKWHSIRSSFLERMRKNYTVGMVVLNSRDFGVPQNRERVFFVGIHKDILDIPTLPWEKSLIKELSFFKKVPRSIREVVGDLGPAGSKSNKRICRAKITFAKTPILRRSPYAGMLFNGAGRPLPSEGQSSTLPASMGGNKTPIIDEGVIFDQQDSFVEGYHAHLLQGGKPYSGEAPKQLRRMTVDECLAIQTFPSDYCLYGKQSSIYRQIGNAVPCMLAYSVAQAARNILEKSE